MCINTLQSDLIEVTSLQLYNVHYHYYIDTGVEKFLGTRIIGMLGKRPSEDLKILFICDTR